MFTASQTVVENVGDALKATTWSIGNNAGVLGEARSGTGNTDGVRGRTWSTNGIGVVGEARTAVGGVGLRGDSTGAGGTGVVAIGGGSSGTNVGLFAMVMTAGSIAGSFDNLGGGGALIVGQSNGVHKFKVDGVGNVFGNSYNVGGADFAESVAVTEPKANYEPGDVMIIDSGLRRTMARSTAAYSTMVAGIYSTKPGIIAAPYESIEDPRRADEIPLAVVGIVPCKVTADNGAIRPGDLLVTSSLAGHAMKGNDRSRMLGAIVGKALEPLEKGTGQILVLVTLQ
jgi:hypothetical protein